MTVEEMHEEIMKHCNGKLCGEDCLIRGVCSPIAGRFLENPDKCKEAMAILHPEVEDIINHPSHYCREGGMECLDEMELIFGKEALKHFCLCNAWKYRYRASAKNGDEDLKKSDFYMRKYKELCSNV